MTAKVLLSLQSKLLIICHRRGVKTACVVSGGVYRREAGALTWFNTEPFTGGFPGGSHGKESACHAAGLGSIPGLEDPLEKGLTTHSCLENCTELVL